MRANIYFDFGYTENCAKGTKYLGPMMGLSNKRFRRTVIHPPDSFW